MECMDLVYGNDGTSYRTFARSCNITPKIERSLLNNYKRYAINDSRAYTRSEIEPENFIYVTSELGTNEEYVVLANNGRMRNYSTPSTYFQAHLIRLKDGSAYYKTGFFDIFSIKFLDYLDIPKWEGKALDNYQPERRHDIGDEKVLEDNQLKSILYCVFSNLRGKKPVKIALDQGEDGYDKRSREVLKTIYRYLPYDFRKRYGFATYMCEKQPRSGMARVVFQLYDYLQIENPGAIDVDLSNVSQETILRIRKKIGKKQICDYVDELVDMKDEARNIHFDQLEELSGGKPLDIQEYLKYREYKKILESDASESQLPEWIEIIFDICDKKGPMYDDIRGDIESRVDNEKYNEYLMAQIGEAGTDYLNMPEKIRHAFIFADYISGIEVDAGSVGNWYAKRMKHNPENGLDEHFAENCASRQNEIERIEKSNPGIESIKTIKEGILASLKNDLKIYREHQRELRDFEKERIESQIKSEDLIDSSSFVNTACNLASKYQNYSDLYDFLRDVIGKTLKQYTEEKIQDRKTVERESVGALKLIDAARKKSLLMDEDYEYCERQINRRLSAIEAERQRQKITIIYVRNIEDFVALIEAVGVRKNEFQKQGCDWEDATMGAAIGNKVFELKLSVIESLMRFLIAPSEDSFRVFRDTNDMVGNDLIPEIINSDLVSEYHMTYMRDDSGGVYSYPDGESGKNSEKYKDHQGREMNRKDWGKILDDPREIIGSFLKRKSR